MNLLDAVTLIFAALPVPMVASTYWLIRQYVPIRHSYGIWLMQLLVGIAVTDMLIGVFNAWLALHTLLGVPDRGWYVFPLFVLELLAISVKPMVIALFVWRSIHGLIPRPIIPNGGSHHDRSGEGDAG